MKLLFLTRGLIYRLCLTIDSFLGCRNDLFILCYHSISNDHWRFGVSQAVFEKQMRWLVAHYQPLDATDLEQYLAGKRKLTKPSFVLTFDDGYQDVLKVVPFCRKLNIQPIIFVLSEPNRAATSELGTQRPLLRLNDITRLMEAGWSVGLHSATHQNLTTLTKREITLEVNGAKKELEREIAKKIIYFAYPRGKYNKQVLDEVRRSGFHLGFSMDSRVHLLLTDKLRVPRVGIDRSHTFAEFQSAFSPTTIRFRQIINMTPLAKYL